jgi:hypothetical protein
MARGWRIVPALVFLACALPLAALPQLAVLNVVLSPGIDPTVGGIITGKIEEPIVASGRYEVLDRSNVDQVLTEKEFQLSSGLVKPEEVRMAGEYLGADLVVAGTVSRVGQTYALSAKMIDVATGKVVAQASAEKEGKIDVLLPLARQVGEQLAARGPGGQAAGAPERPAEEPAPVAPAFYRHAALFEGGYIGVGDDGMFLGMAYFFSLLPKVGLTASAGYGMSNGSYAINAGGFFTPFPQLSVGFTGGYTHAKPSSEYDTEISSFGIGPVVLVRIWRVAVGADLKYVVSAGGLYYLVGVGFCF